MDFSSASDQPSGVRRRPFSCKAAQLSAPGSSCSPSASLETESDDAVLLHRKISRSEGRIAAAHQPAARQERKKSAIIIPLKAANVASSSIIFFLLFRLFLASVSEASNRSQSNKREGAGGTINSPTPPRKPSSSTPKRGSLRQEFAVRSLPNMMDAKGDECEDEVVEFSRSILKRPPGEIFSCRVTFCEKQERNVMFSDMQDLNRVSLYYGNAKLEFETEGLQHRKVYEETFLENFEAKHLRKIIRMAVNNAQPNKSDQLELTSELTENMFRVFVHGGSGEAKSGAAVLVIWTREKAPRNNTFNIGMVYSAVPPLNAKISDDEKMKRIRDSAKNVLTLLNYYNRLVIPDRSLPRIDEYHAELIGGGTSRFTEVQIAKMNLHGYNDVCDDYSPIFNFGYANNSFFFVVMSGIPGAKKEAIEDDNYSSRRGRLPSIRLNLPSNTKIFSEPTTSSTLATYYKAIDSQLKMTFHENTPIYSKDQKLNRISLLSGPSDFKLGGEGYLGDFGNILKKSFVLEKFKKVLQKAFEIALINEGSYIYRTWKATKECEGIRMVLFRRSKAVEKFEYVFPSENRRVKQPAGAGTVILVIWRPEKDPYNNHANIGMMYLVTPSLEGYPPEVQDELVGTAAENTVAVVQGYNHCYTELLKAFPKIEEFHYPTISNNSSSVLENEVKAIYKHMQICSRGVPSMFLPIFDFRDNEAYVFWNEISKLETLCIRPRNVYSTHQIKIPNQAEGRPNTSIQDTDQTKKSRRRRRRKSTKT